MKFGDFGDLLILTLRDPGAALRLLRGLDLPLAARWSMIALASVLSAVLLGIERLFADPATASADSLGLLTVAGISLVLSVLSVLLIYRIGRAFGGTGTFEDALLLFAWIDLIMVGLQAMQLLLMLLMPGTESLMLLITGAVSIYLTVMATKALHGFSSTLQVALGIFGISLLAAFAITILAMLFGIPLQVTS